MYRTNTGWCVICWKMLHVVRWDLRRVPYSSTLCNSSCIAAFLMYRCSCQTIQTSITELLLIRNSFELILVYSCPICTSNSSHGCFTLCHCHCQALGSCEGLQTHWGRKQSSWLWSSSHGHCFSRIPQNRASSSCMPRLSQPCQQAYRAWYCSASVPSLMPNVVEYPGG